MAISGSENEIRGHIRPDKGRVKVAKILMGNWKWECCWLEFPFL